MYRLQTVYGFSRSRYFPLKRIKSYQKYIHYICTRYTFICIVIMVSDCCRPTAVIIIFSFHLKHFCQSCYTIFIIKQTYNYFIRFYIFTAVRLLYFIRFSEMSDYSKIIIIILYNRHD